MLNQDECHSGIGWQSGEQLIESLEPPRRGANANHWKALLRPGTARGYSLLLNRPIRSLA